MVRVTSTPTPTPIEEHLAVARERYLAFVRGRIADDALAEDVLQDAILKALIAAPDIGDDDGLARWFYRVLRNAITDAYRRRDVRNRRTIDIEAARDLPQLSEADEPLLCECFRDLLPSLHPSYAEVLNLELEGLSPAETAGRLGISENNLKVRRHRARQALKERLQDTCRLCADHGCLDCACKR